MTLSVSQSDDTLAAPPGPADRKVVVTFTAPDDWAFSPESVTMDAPGNVILVRSSSSVTWTFVTAAIKLSDDQFSVTVPSNGDRCIIRDERRYKGTYQYLVVVTQGGAQFVSPDPEIINSGP